MTANIYIAKVKDFENNTVLPIYVEEKINSLPTFVSNQKRAAYGVLRKAIKEIVDTDDDFSHIYKNSNGKPVSTKYNFSISHSKEIVAIALSDANIGIDIEKINTAKNINKLSSTILHTEEIIPRNYNEFYKLWTKKEAIFKLYGEKIFIPKNINTKKEKTKTFFIEDYCLSVATNAECEIKINKLF